MNTPLLEIEDLYAEVGGKPIIKGFNLQPVEGSEKVNPNSKHHKLKLFGMFNGYYHGKNTERK